MDFSNFKDLALFNLNNNFFLNFHSNIYKLRVKGSGFMAEGYWKTPLLLFSLFLIGLATLISFGLTGKLLMYYTETLTDKE